MLKILVAKNAININLLVFILPLCHLINCIQIALQNFEKLFSVTIKPKATYFVSNINTFNSNY